MISSPESYLSETTTAWSPAQRTVNGCSSSFTALSSFSESRSVKRTVSSLRVRFRTGNTHHPIDTHTPLDSTAPLQFPLWRYALAARPTSHRNQTAASLRPLNHPAIASTREHTSHVPRITARVGGTLVTHERRVPSGSLLDQVDIRVERDRNAEISQTVHYIASAPRLYVPAGCSPAIYRRRWEAWPRRRPYSRPSTTRARERTRLP